MQQISRTPALLAAALAVTLAACAPVSGPATDAAPQASYLVPAPQPRLGFNDFTAPQL